MNKFFLLWLFGMALFFWPRQLFSSVGFFSQTIDFDYQLVEEYIYYQDGYLNNELEDSTISNKNSEYGINYLINVKTGYHHDFFAVMLDYVFSIETEQRYNQIDVNIESLNKRVENHRLSPSFFLQWEPLRLGLAYNLDIRSSSIKNKQRVSIRPGNSLSLYFHVFFPELWNSSPLGMGAYYEIAFDPSLATGEIKNHLFQSAGLSVNINFNYLSQFQMMFTYQRLDEKVTLYKVKNDSVYFPVAKDYLVRYYVDYSFVHQIIKELAIRVGIGNLVYSDYESPVLNFNIGLTYTFLRI